VQTEFLGKIPMFVVCNESLTFVFKCREIKKAVAGGHSEELYSISKCSRPIAPLIHHCGDGATRPLSRDGDAEEFRGNLTVEPTSRLPAPTFRCLVVVVRTSLLYREVGRNSEAISPRLITKM